MKIFLVILAFAMVDLALSLVLMEYLSGRHEDLPFTGTYLMRYPSKAMSIMKSSYIALLQNFNEIQKLTFFYIAAAAISLLIGFWKQKSYLIIPFILTQVSSSLKCVLEIHLYFLGLFGLFVRWSFSAKGKLQAYSRNGVWVLKLVSSFSIR